MTDSVRGAPAGNGILDGIASQYSYGNRKGGLNNVWAIKRQQPGANWSTQWRFPAEAVGAIATAAGFLIVVLALWVVPGTKVLSASIAPMLVLWGIVLVLLGSIATSVASPALMILRNRLDPTYRLLVEPGHAILTLSIARPPAIDRDGRVIIESRDFAVMRKEGKGSGSR